MKSQLLTYLTLAMLYGIGLSGAQGRKKRRENAVVCEAGSNTFYHPQAEMCLQCDKCNMGYSMVPLQVHIYKNKPKKVSFESYVCIEIPFTLL